MSKNNNSITINSKSKKDSTKNKTVQKKKKIVSKEANKVVSNGANKIASKESNKIASKKSNKIASNGANKIASKGENKIASKGANKIASNESNKIASKEANNDHDFDEKMEEIRQALRENFAQQKKLMNDLKELMTLHKKEVKMSSKIGNRGNSGKHTGINKPVPVPQPLKKLLDIEEEMLPRSKITNLMYQYFTKNNMYNSKTKKEIIPNDKIKKIFGMRKGDVINFYNIQTWLKKVYDENADNNALNIED